MDYEPSKIVQQVLFDTKLNQGKSNELPSQRAKIEADLNKWRDESDTVDLILKLLESEKKNEIKIRENAQKLLANKSQIDDFMRYPKKKKIEKLKDYKLEVNNKRKKCLKERTNGEKILTKAQRKALKKKIIQNTQIICTTLSMSANEKLEYLDPGEIEYLIVDEACQSIELNNLIPFEHRPERIILVGDQQ